MFTLERLLGLPATAQTLSAESGNIDREPPYHSRCLGPSRVGQCGRQLGAGPAQQPVGQATLPLSMILLLRSKKSFIKLVSLLKMIRIATADFSVFKDIHITG